MNKDELKAHSVKDPVTNPEYGIYDTVDKCWMGNENGPLLYQSETASKLAATIINEQFGYSFRYRRTQFVRHNLRLRDIVSASKTPEQAIKDIEKRAK